MTPRCANVATSMRCRCTASSATQTKARATVVAGDARNTRTLGESIVARIRSVVVLTALLVASAPSPHAYPTLARANDAAAVAGTGPAHVRTWYYYGLNGVNESVPAAIMARYADYAEDDGYTAEHVKAFKAAGGRFAVAYSDPSYVPYCYPPFTAPAGRCDGPIGAFARDESAWFHGRDGTRGRRGAHGTTGPKRSCARRRGSTSSSPTIRADRCTAATCRRRARSSTTSTTPASRSPATRCFATRGRHISCRRCGRWSSTEPIRTPGCRRTAARSCARRASSARCSKAACAAAADRRPTATTTGATTRTACSRTRRSTSSPCAS